MLLIIMSRGGGHDSFWVFGEIVHAVTRVRHYLETKPLGMELPKAGLLASRTK